MYPAGKKPTPIPVAELGRAWVSTGHNLYALPADYDKGAWGKMAVVMYSSEQLMKYTAGQMPNLIDVDTYKLKTTEGYSLESDTMLTLEAKSGTETSMLAGGDCTCEFAQCDVS